MSTIETFAPAGTWSADPVHSNVSFEVGYAGVNAFRGGFKEFTAVLSGETLEGSATVASVDVKDEQLNGHLQTPDFFDAQRFPEITFKATELRRLEGGRVEAKGELTIKGVTKPVVVSGTIAQPLTDPYGNERIGLNVGTTVDRTEFGVSWNAELPTRQPALANEVKLVAELFFVRQA